MASQQATASYEELQRTDSFAAVGIDWKPLAILLGADLAMLTYVGTRGCKMRTIPIMLSLAFAALYFVHAYGQAFRLPFRTWPMSRRVSYCLGMISVLGIVIVVAIGLKFVNPESSAAAPAPSSRH